MATANQADQDSSSLFVTGDGDVELDYDNISLTSTVDSEHDPDEDFCVENILAERPNQGQIAESEKQYLVQWENYPLHRCTWEVRENLSKKLYEGWQKQRQKELQGEHRPFDVKIFETALADAQRSKATRHMRRNEKRMRIGIPMTEPYPDHHNASSPPLTASICEQECKGETITGVDKATKPSQVQNDRTVKQTRFKALPLAKGSTKDPSPVVKEPSTSNPDLESGQTNASRTAPTSIAECQGTDKKPSEQGITTASSTSTSAKPPRATSSMSVAKSSGTALRATRTITPKPLLRRPHKQRKNLKDAMMDPGKTPKFMSTMRGVNQLRKKAADINDSAPEDPSMIPAKYFVTTRPPARCQPDKSISGISPNPSATPVIQTPSVNPQSQSSHKPKPKKTVRFAEDATAFTAPTDLAPKAIMGSSDTSAPVRKVSLQSYKQRAIHHTVVKKAVFGPSSSQEVMVEFRPIPRTTNTWLVNFSTEPVIQFKAMCTAADFFSGDQLYNPEDGQAKLASGTLDASNEQALLHVVATNLGRQSSALYASFSDFAILVFPSHCAAWAPIAAPFNTSSNKLGYLIFKPRYPLEVNHYPALTNTAICKVTTSSGLRRQLMTFLAAIDYSILLPPNAGEKHVFYLLYYPSEAQVFQALSLWLRACHPACLLFDSQEKGAWRAYQETTRSGAIILHESAEKTIKSIPRLWDTLMYDTHTFWSLSSSGHETVLTPIIKDKAAITEVPARLGLTQLFPTGRAILITPSFTISRPGGLRQLLEWFKNRAAYPPCVLVVSANFSDYLFNLYVEKYQDSKILSQSSDYFDLPKNRARHEDRLRSWELFKELSDPAYHGFRSHEEPAEDIAGIIWADELINGDDEESLVNWFASWSMTRLDAYREFHVLGTDAEDTKRASRVVRVPNYAEGTINDPDHLKPSVVLEATPYEFRSKKLQGDRPADFAPWFDTLNRLKHKSVFQMYLQAIRWLDQSMAAQHGDHRAQYGTYERWLQACPRFTKTLNTLVGFFYTSEMHWEKGSQKLTSKASRRPWLAFLRPVNPHLNQHTYSALELLIWDCGAKYYWPPNPSRGNISLAQLNLIDFVQKEVPQTDSRYFLERVFVGGWNIGVNMDPACPIDISCETLEAILEGHEGRAWYVPPFDEALFKAGWKLLDDKQPAIPPFPKHLVDKEEPERIIFHAPPGRYVRQSACTNGLYNAALRARRRDPNCVEFLHAYKPTLQWYQHLEDEKRLYNHVNVDSWGRIFKDLKIG